MLVLSRKQKQEIMIGDNVKITVLKVKGNTVRLGIEAPRDVHVVRGELPQFHDPAGPDSSQTKSDESTAEFTVVFSNSEDAQTPKVDVIPFESDSRPRRPSGPENRHANANDSNTETVRSIQFRERLPNALQHNRLKEIVNQLTSKPSN